MSDRCIDPIVFPRELYNRPALDWIDYRIGRYPEIREALLRGIDAEPLLAGWTHRGADDAGIALLEGAAVLGDILTFYQELYANQAFLRTATWRDSVSDLVRLIGYRLSPGLGGRGTFAFEVEGEAAIAVPAGTPLQAQVSGLETKADFATEEDLLAYPWLGRFNLFRPLDYPSIGSTTKSFAVAAPDPEETPLGLGEGDRLLLGVPYPSGDPDRLLDPELVVVDAVEDLHGQPILRIKGGLRRSSSVPELVGYRIGRSFRHLGHNAPPTVTEVSGSGSSASVSQSNISYIRNLGSSTPNSSFDKTTVSGTLGGGSSIIEFESLAEFSSAKTVVSPTIGSLDLPLAQEVDDLAQGSTVVVHGELQSSSASGNLTVALLRSAAELKPASYTWGALTAPSTLIRLEENLSTSADLSAEGVSGTFNEADIRELQIHETLSPLITLIAAPGDDETQSSGHNLYFLGTAEQAATLDKRPILMALDDAEPEPASVQSVEALDPVLDDVALLRKLTLDAEVDYELFPNAKAPLVTVFGNLAEASQGKAEPEAALGNGDNRETFQTFKLPKAPLTYLLEPGATPPEMPELEIWVDGRLWSRVDVFFGQDADAQVYIVREDANGDSWVQFGDGQTGARLPTGVGNVVAVFRSGQGAFGTLEPDTKVQVGARIRRLKEALLPGTVSGGEEPESGGKAREAAPGKIQSLDRLVSLQDFESETLAIPGVRRARATWSMVDNVPSVVLTVLMETGREAELTDVRQTLNHDNRCRGPARVPIVVIQGSLRPLWLDAAVTIDSSYREDDVLAACRLALGVDEGDDDAAVTETPRGLFVVERRRFAQSEYASRIEGTIQNVPGVLWVKVKGFGPADAASDPTPPAAPWPFNDVAACGDEQILSLPFDNVLLTPAAAPDQAECG